MQNFTIEKVLTLLLASFFSVQLAASSIVVDGQVEYIIPQKSPVSISSTGPYLEAHFNGKFILSGMYYYGYASNNLEGEKDDSLLQLIFVPDQKTAKFLPYWKREGIVKEIWLTNSEAFVKAVIAPSAIEELKRKKVASIKGRATVLVSSYAVDVVCDSPSYSVEFLSIAGFIESIASRDFKESIGC